MSTPVTQKKPRLHYIPCDAHQAGALVYTYNLYVKDDLEPTTKPSRRQWMAVRDKWINEQESIHGKDNLTCVLCKKTGLKGFSKKIKEVATVDHILPVSLFPKLWRDPTNFQIACNRCNSKKSNKVLTPINQSVIMLQQ